MGLMKELVLLPMAPLRFMIWTADKVQEQAEAAYFSEAAGARQLQEIDEARRRGELDEDEAQTREEEILERQIARADAGEQNGGG